MSPRGKNRSSNFAQFVLGLACLGQAIALGLIVMEVKLPLPRFALASSMEAIRGKGLDLSFESMSFTLLGTIQVDGVVIRATHENMPPLTKIDQFVAHGSPWRLLTAEDFFSGIKIRGGKAFFHETKKEEPIMTDIMFDVVFSGAKSLGKVSGRLGNTQVRLGGETHLSELFPKRKGPPKLPFFKRPDLPENYASLVQVLGQVKYSLRNNKSTSLHGYLSRFANGHLLSVDGQAKDGNLNRGMTFESIVANFSIKQQGKQWVVNGTPESRIQKAVFGDHGGVTNTRIRLNNSNCTLHDLGETIQAELRFEDIKIEKPYDGVLECIDAEVEVNGLDRVKVESFVKSNRLYLAWNAWYGISDGTGSATGHGKIFPQDLLSDRFRELDRTNYLRAPSGISLLNAKVSLGKGASINKAAFRATGRNMTWQGVKTDSARLTARFLKGGDWLLGPMAIDLGDSHAKGSYARKASRDYRFLLEGIMRPEKINPWMGTWWPNLWRDFKIGESPLVGDFDVSGRWREPTGDHRKVFGSIRFKSLSYRSLPVMAGEVKILADVNRTIARKLDLDLENGWAKGGLSWENSSARKTSGVTRFSLRGATKPSDCLDLFGPNTRETLIKFKSADPITFEAEGSAGDDANASNLFLKAFAGKPLSYSNVPLQTLSFELQRKGTLTDIRNLHFQFAGGLAKGSLQHSETDATPRLKIELALEGAERAKVVEALRLSKVFSTLDERDIPRPPAQDRVEAPTKKNRGGLDFTLAAKGNPNDPLSFEGVGDIKINDPNLGSIKLFGPLSKTLLASPIPLPTGSVNFTRLASAYSLAGRRATLDGLAIASSSALIRGNGELSLVDNTIDLEARMYLLGGFGSKIPILGKIAEIVDPLSKFLELELHGSFDSPKWSLKVDPKLLLKR